MREPTAPEQSEPAMEPQSIERETDALEVARQQADIQARLDETNRKLSQALERVDELTASSLEAGPRLSKPPKPPV